MPASVLRGATYCAGRTGNGSVTSHPDTQANDTLFVVRYSRGLDTVNMEAPVVAGVTFTQMHLEDFGNATLGVWRGVVNTAGPKTIALNVNGQGNVHGAVCLTYNGAHTLAPGNPQTSSSGTSTANGNLTAPFVNSTETAFDWIVCWTASLTAGMHGGVIIDTAHGTTGGVFRPAKFSDNASELVVSRAVRTTAGNTGGASASLENSAGALINTTDGWVGFAFTVYRTSALQPPIVGAGADATGTVGTAFSRTATENANGSGITARGWTRDRGEYEDPEQISTGTAMTYTPGAPGTYKFRYSATNSGGTSFDEFFLTVANAPPVVQAGNDATIMHGQAFNRNGAESATGVTSREWRVMAGPSNVNQVISDTWGVTWTPPFVGQYTLRYSATNSAGTTTDTLILTVTAAPADPVMPDDGWTYLAVPWGETLFTLRDQAPGQEYEFQIRAVDAANPPNASGWSTSVFATTAPDTDAPSIPAAAEVAAGKLTIQVTHRLGKSTGGEFNLESDVVALNCYVVTDATTPIDKVPVDNGGTFAGIIPVRPGSILGNIPVVATLNAPYTSGMWVKVTAVDSYGNESEPSAGARATSELIADAFMASLTVSKVTSGTITSTWVQAAEIITGTVGSRVRVGYHGIELFDMANRLTLDANTSDGTVYMVGTITTGYPGGKRITVNGQDNAIEFFPQGSNNRRARIYSYVPSNYPNDLALELRAVDSDTLNSTSRVYLLPDSIGVHTNPIGAGGDLIKRSGLTVNPAEAFLSVHDIIGTAPYELSDSVIRASVSVETAGYAEMATYNGAAGRMSEVRIQNNFVYVQILDGNGNRNGGFMWMGQGNTGSVFFGKNTPTRDKFVAFEADRSMLSDGGNNFLEIKQDAARYYANGTLSTQFDPFGCNSIRFNSHSQAVEFRAVLKTQGGGDVFFYWSGGTLNIGTGGSFVKTFVIDHPIDSDKHLVHATVEGPVAGIEYTGSVTIVNNEAVAELPHYFEALAAVEGRTVHLTVKLNELMVDVPPTVGLMRGQPIGRPAVPAWARIPVAAASDVVDGQFRVLCSGQDGTVVDWLVKAVRKDIPQFEVEPLKSSGTKRNVGPYTWFE